MATIVETGIRDVVVTVLRPDPAQPIQMLVTCESYDTAGNTVRRVAFPDWWDRLSAEDKALLGALYTRFSGAACDALEITRETESAPQTPPAGQQAPETTPPASEAVS